jgi:hypothetical protein
MNSKIINVVLICLFSLCIAGKANAGLIVGDLYADEAGIQWEYVGYYDLLPEDGSFDRPSDKELLNCGVDKSCIENITLIPVFNGIEAATYLFGELSGDEEYAISTTAVWLYEGVDALVSGGISSYVINHKAWYDIYTGNSNGQAEGIMAKDENYDESSDFYNSAGAHSAYIADRASAGEKINYVFKSVTTSVPEPSTLVIFSLALLGLTTRHLKKRS